MSGNERIDLPGPRGGELLLEGWAIDPGAKAVPREVYVELVSSRGLRRRYRAVLGVMRDEIRDRFGVEAYHRAGWLCAVPVLPAAEIEQLWLRIVSADGQSRTEIKLPLRVRLQEQARGTR